MTELLFCASSRLQRTNLAPSALGKRGEEIQVWFLFYLTTPLIPAHTSSLLNPHAQTSFTTQPCAQNAQRQKGSLAEQGSPASPTTCCPSSEQDEGTSARSFTWYSFLALQRGSKSHHTILHLPCCTCSIMGICWSTFQDVSKPPPSLSQRIMWNWKENWKTSDLA